MLRQILAEQAGGDVIWAAGREADDEFDRLIRIILGRGISGQYCERTKAKREQTSKARTHSHGFPLMSRAGR
jgi:hypothetical protein